MPKITLEAARVNAGYTQQELADAMRVSRSSVIKWESGQTAMRTGNFYLFCHLVGLSEDDILLPSKSTKSRRRKNRK